MPQRRASQKGVGSPFRIRPELCSFSFETMLNRCIATQICSNSDWKASTLGSFGEKPRRVTSAKSRKRILVDTVLWLTLIVHCHTVHTNANIFMPKSSHKDHCNSDKTGRQQFAVHRKTRFLASTRLTGTTNISSHLTQHANISYLVRMWPETTHFAKTIAQKIPGSYFRSPHLSACLLWQSSGS